MAGSSETNVRAGVGKRRKAPLRPLSVILIALLALCSGITLAYGDDAPSSESEVAALSAPPAQPGGPELEAKRTATSQTFLLPGGGRETRIYETPINYKDSEGHWQPIEEGLEHDDGATLTNGDNRFNVKLPARLGAGAVRVDLGDDWIAQRLLGDETQPAELAADDTAHYESADAATSFEFSTLGNGLREEIEIADGAQPHTFRYELSASANLTPSQIEDGSIEFRDEGGELIASMPAPVVSDGAPGSPVESEPVGYEVKPLAASGRWVLSVNIDPEWLSSPQRVWPVRVDPTTILPGLTLDCTIRGGKGLPNSGGCGEGGFKELQTGFWPTAAGSKGDERARSLLKFNISSIPLKASISSAALGLFAPNAAKGTDGVEIHEMTTGWTKKATWKTTNGNALWPNGVEGGAFNATVAGQVLTSDRGTQAGSWTFSGDGMAELIRKWMAGNGNGNKGLIAKLIDDTPTGCSGTCPERYVTFASSAAVLEVQRPYLKVLYNLPAPSSSRVSSPTEGQRSARRIKLKANWSGSGVVGVTFEFREGKKGLFHTIPAELVRKADGSPVSWPLETKGKEESEPLYFDAAHASSTLRKKGGSIQIRAIFEGTGTYSVPVEVGVDRFLGGPKDATAEIGPGSVNLLTGNLTMTQSDVSIPGFSSSLAFSRTLNSREATGTPKTGVLGQGWKPGVPVEQAGGSQWRSVKLITESEVYEEETYSFSYALLTSAEGYEVAFEKEGETFVTPPELSGLNLAPSAGKLILSDPGGNRTTFENLSGGNEYVPTLVSQAGGTGNTTQMVYKIEGANRRLTMIIPPSPEGRVCSETNATTTAGCHALTFTYAPATKWEAPAEYGERLQKITYHAPGNGGPWEVANYEYDEEGRLIAAWDPRISPPLKEKYTYEPGGQVKSVTPPGQEPWEMEYGVIDEEEANGRLMAVKRASLVSSPSVAQTTIAYGVAVSGEGAPYAMGGSSVAQWGQADIPVDATAIFRSGTGKPAIQLLSGDRLLHGCRRPAGKHGYAIGRRDVGTVDNDR